jgi:hypothetical protein
MIPTRRRARAGNWLAVKTAKQLLRPVRTPGPVLTEPDIAVLAVGATDAAGARRADRLLRVDDEVRVTC